MPFLNNYSQSAIIWNVCSKKNYTCCAKLCDKSHRAYELMQKMHNIQKFYQWHIENDRNHITAA